MNCPHCQHVLRDDARFCDGCGLSMISFNTPTEKIDSAALADILSQTDPLLGQVLDSKYELVARLGEGGMGAVYRARRIHIGDEVAVKVLHQSFVADGDAVERFRREARAAAMLRHPNVVTIHDFGEARGSAAPAYIVMELAEGSSLRALLRSEGRLAPARAVALMQDICAGVGAAHRRQIVHRDLKPDNIIILPPDGEGERETAKVVDFGIAKLRDLAAMPTLTQAGTLMGTPYYMSPEQCRGDSLDARSDVYSLGAVLYEMLAGVPPFTAANITGVVTKHLTEPPPPFAPGAGVPGALEDVCRRALAKDVDARQPEATTLARELQAALSAPAAQRATTKMAAIDAAPAAVFSPAAMAQPPNASLNAGAAESSPAASAANTQPTVAAGTPQQPFKDHARLDATPAALASHAQPARKSKSLWWVIGGLVVLLGGGLILGSFLVFYLAGSKATPSKSNRTSNSGIVSPATTNRQTRTGQKSAPESAGLKAVLKGHLKDVRAVAFSPDGKTLFGGSYRAVRLWDTGTWTLRRENSMGEINPAYALSADGKQIATGGTNENSIKVWDAENGALKLTLDGHDKGVLSLDFAPDGQTLVSGSYDNTARLWDTGTGALKRKLADDDLNAIFSVAFTPDGRTLASGSYHEIKLWDAQTGTLKRTLAAEGMGITYRLAFSPDGKTLAGASDGTVKLWDVSGM
ncbi:MAG TPA: WD40 repeat domain-containing serine/threonine-protein kinase [Pyrinomonadaceae bacterium]